VSDRQRAVQTLLFADLALIGPKVVPILTEGPIGTGAFKQQLQAHSLIALGDLHMSQIEREVLSRGWATPLDPVGISLRYTMQSRIRQDRETAIYTCRR
jgi:hypothetical protein